MLLPLFWGAIGLGAQEVQVASGFQPAAMVEGQQGRYIVQVQVSQEGSGSLAVPQVSTPDPEVPAGLVLEYGGPRRSQPTSIINGRAERSITFSHIFSARASEAGVFRIPAYEISVDGQPYTVPEAALRVGAASEEDFPLISAQLLLPYDKVYVGQALKANFQIVASDSIRQLQPNSLEKSGEAFSEVQRAPRMMTSRTERDGENFGIYSLPISLTPIMSGTHELSYSVDVQALFPAPGAGRVPGDDIFGSFGFRNTPGLDWRRLRLETETKTIEVRPLPEDGQPADYSGAIGEFILKAMPASNQATVGDPLVLRLEVTGSGNFDRIVAPELDLGSAWSAYDPEINFSGADSLGYSGTLRMDYPLVPRRAEAEAIPPVAFNFFDPVRGEYVTLETAPIPMDVAPAADGAAAAETEDFRASTGDEATEAPPEEPREWFVIETEEGSRLSDLRPAFAHGWFWAAQGVPALALALLGLVSWRRRYLDAHPEARLRIEARQGLKEVMAQAEATAQAGDARAFGRAASAAIRLAWAQRSGKPAQALADLDLLAEIRHHAPAHESAARAMLTELEALRYRPETEANLPDLQQQLRSLTADLTSA